VVIDATGQSAAMQAGFDYVGHGGTYVLVSVVRQTIAFSDPLFHAREMNLLGSRNATPEDFKEVFTAMAKGLVPAEALVTHRAPLEAAPDCFPQWIRPEAGVIKALLEIS
jgi:threonine dehydrogenase-like Zn-dependent dehydrogenase